MATGQLEYEAQLYEGKGVRQDLRQAARCVQKAVDQGLAEAQLKYIRCLENG